MARYLGTSINIYNYPQVPAVSRSHGSRVSCGRDADCSLTAACIEAECADPCVTTPCPMQGGICKVRWLRTNKHLYQMYRTWHLYL